MSDHRDEHMEDESIPLISAARHADDELITASGNYSTISAGHNDDGTSQLHGREAPYVGVDNDNSGYYQNPQADVAVGGEHNTDTEQPIPTRGGPTVTCRICETEITLEGSPTHVVRCRNCKEVTPIRAAPPGKKYVRCPCNCLLICKASSNRIACPRPNCRRVITLVATAPMGTAVRAPAGTCRVQCCHCQEMFMFNTLANTVANCPHCKKSSSVGANYARSRALIHFVAFLISLLVFLGVVIGTFHADTHFIYVLWLLMVAAVAYCVYRFLYFARLKISQVLGPI